MGTNLSENSLKLSEHHRKILVEESGINEDVIQARGYTTVYTPEHLCRLGFSQAVSRNVPCLLLPIHNVHGESGMYRIRPDVAPVFKGKPAKYLSPKGARMCLDVPPAIRAKLGNPSIDLWVTEGEKKCDSAVSHGLCCIGLLGVACWRGTNAEGGKTALADWEEIALNNRKVFIAFDSDVVRKKGVYTQMQRLQQFLEGRGAKVSIVVFPEAQSGEKCGLDDFFARGKTVEELYTLAQTNQVTLQGPGPEAAKPEKQGSAEDDEAAQIPALAQAICEKHHFAKDGGGILYVWESGVYIPKGENTVHQCVKHFLEDAGLADHWSSHKSSEVIQFIRIDAPELWQRPPLDTINVRNGLLDLKSGELLPHSPEYLSPIQLPVSFDANADCPNWLQYVVPCFPSDNQDGPFEIAAWLMTPDTSIQKALLLIGEGSNGKSTFLKALIGLLGKAHVTALSLQKLETDRFSVARLVGKLANICPDLPSAHLAETSTFKTLTGEDGAITGEIKYRDSFEFQSYARLVFSANQPPRSADATFAFFRRWLIYSFSRTFEEGTEQVPVSSTVLDRLLTAEQELSGVLNRALALLPRIREKGLTESAQMKAAWTEFRQETDPLAVWLEKYTQEDIEAVTPRHIVTDSYKTHCLSIGQTPPTSTAFGTALKRLRPSWGTAQRSIDGKVTWCYIGVRLLDGGGNTPSTTPKGTHTSQGSQSSTNCIEFPAVSTLHSPASQESNTRDNNRQNPVNSVNPVKVLSTPVFQTTASGPTVKTGGSPCSSTIVLTATPEQQKQISAIATKRKEGHDHCRRPHEDRGTDEKNLAGELTGIFGELLTVDWCEREGLTVTDWEPYENTPVSRPDCKLNGVPVEIKTVSSGSSYCYVNEDQRSRFADIPGLLYLPVLRRGDYQAILCKPIPVAEVAKWKRLDPADNSKVHDPCWSCPVERLQPLCNVGELLSALQGKEEKELVWK